MDDTTGGRKEQKGDAKQGVGGILKMKMMVIRRVVRGGGEGRGGDE